MRITLTSRKTIHYVCLGGLLAIAMLLWGTNLDKPELSWWFCNEILESKKNISSFWPNTRWYNQMPLYFVFHHFWSSHMPFNEWIRTGNLIMHCFTVIFIYKTTFRLSRQVAPACAAAIFFITTPFNSYLVLNGRCYPFLLMFFTGSIYFLISNSQNPKYKKEFFLAIFTAGMSLSHFVGIYLTVLILLWRVFELIVDLRISKKKLIHSLAGLTIFVTGYLLCISRQFNLISKFASSPGNDFEPGKMDYSVKYIAHNLYDVIRSRFAGIFQIDATAFSIKENHTLYQSGVLILICILFAVGIFKSKWKYRIFALMIFPLSVVVPVALAPKIDIGTRYISYIIGVISIFVGLSLGKIWLVKDHIIRRIFNFSIVFFLCLCIFIYSWNAFNIKSQIMSEPDIRWTAALKYIKSEYGEKNPIIVAFPERMYGAFTLIAYQLGVEPKIYWPSTPVHRIQNEITKGKNVHILRSKWNGPKQKRIDYINYLKGESYKETYKYFKEMDIWTLSPENPFHEIKRTDLYPRDGVENYIISDLMDKIKEPAMLSTNNFVFGEHDLRERMYFQMKTVHKKTPDGIVWVSRGLKNGIKYKGIANYHKLVYSLQGGTSSFIGIPASKHKASEVDFKLKLSRRNQVHSTPQVVVEIHQEDGWRQKKEIILVKNSEDEINVDPTIRNILQITNKNDTNIDVEISVESSEIDLQQSSLSDQLEFAKVARIQKDGSVVYPSEFSKNIISHSRLHEPGNHPGIGQINSSWKFNSREWSAIGNCKVLMSDNTVREGIWAHPISNEKISISFSTHEKNTVRGFAGYTLKAHSMSLRQNLNSKVTFSIYQNDVLIKKLDINRKEEAVTEFSVNLHPTEKELNTIRVEVTIEADAWAHFVFDLFTAV